MLDATVAPRVAHQQHDSAASLARPSMSCGGITGPQWFVCQPQPQAERWATTNLIQRGYETYLPLLAIRRRDRAIRSLWHVVEEPLYARYLFVRFDSACDPWTPIWHTPGISRLLTKDDRKPNPCPEAAVLVLQATEASRRILGTPEALHRPGAVCSPAVGVLAGHRAVVLRVTRSHATVALMLLGALREVTLPLDILAPAT